MEKLSRRSDSAVETPSGLLAVVPLARSGLLNGAAWFEFKAHMLGEVTRIEWPENAPLIVIDPDTAKTLVRLGYAGPVSDQQVEDYNAAVDAHVSKLPKQAPAPTPPAPAPAPAPAAATAVAAAPTPTPAPAPTPAPGLLDLNAPAPAPGLLDLNAPPPQPID